MTVSLSMFAGVGAQFSDDNGAPLAGGLIYVYLAGGTTPTPTYQTSSGSGGASNSNPIVLDSSGRVPYQIWLTDTTIYKFVLKTSGGSTVRTEDNVYGASIKNTDNTVKVVATFAALSSTTATIGQQVSVLGSQGGIFDAVSSAGLTANTGTVAVNGSIAFSRQYVFLTVKMFGAACDNGVTNDTTAIQAAIDFACPLVGAGFPVALYLNPGGCKVTSTLNMTNSRTGGTRQRDGFKFFGDGWGSVIYGETGDRHAIIETTGSQWLIMEDITVASGTTNKSTVGIYQGVSVTLPQTQNQVFNRVKILLHDDAAANAGQGTIALWNYGAEENTYNAIYFNANVAAIFTTQNALFGGYQHSYQTLSASHSLGVTSFVGECFLVSIGRRIAPLFLQGVNSFTGSSIYISNSGGDLGTNDDAISIYAGCVGVQISGTIEEVATIHVFDSLFQSSFRSTFGIIKTPTAPIIKLERGGAGVIEGCTFNIQNNDASSQTRNLFSLVPGALTEQVSCYITDSEFKTNLPLGRTGLQENLLWNDKTNNITISGDGWSYKIQDYKHIIGLKGISLGTTGTVTKIAAVKMPTAVAAVSAGGLAIKVSGMVGTTPPGDSARTTGSYSAECTLSTSQNGGITYGAAVNTLSSVSNVNGAGNTLTAVAMTLVADTNPLNAAIKLTPTITGVNVSSATFTGTVEMIWSGWDARAPSLLRVGQTAP